MKTPVATPAQRDTFYLGKTGTGKRAKGPVPGNCNNVFFSGIYPGDARVFFITTPGHPVSGLFLAFLTHAAQGNRQSRNTSSLQAAGRVAFVEVHNSKNQIYTLIIEQSLAPFLVFW